VAPALAVGRATRAEARPALFEDIEVFCNGERRHSALGHLSSRAVARRCAEEAVAA